MPASSARLLVPLAVVALGLGLLVLFVVMLAPTEPTNGPDGSDPLAFDPEAEFADDDEDAVAEVESMLRDLGRQIREGAAGGAIYHLSEGYSGTAFFENLSAPARTVGGVTVREGKLSGVIQSLEGFRKWVSEKRLDRCAFKVVQADLIGESKMFASIRVEAERVAEGRCKRWVGWGDALLERFGNRWTLTGFVGRKGRTEEGEVRFRDVTASTGLTLLPTKDDRTTTRETFGRLFIGGIAVADADGDGDTDLYVPRVGSNVFFRNDGGKFVDAAPALGIADRSAGSSALFLDTDNDGDLDLLVASYEPPQLPDPKSGKLFDNVYYRALSLFRKDGERYADVTNQAGLRFQGPATMLCAADVDRDGDVDFYVCYYRDDAKDDPKRPEEVPADVFNARNGEPNQLWINQGDGRFVEEAAKRGVDDRGWGLAAAFADYDDDGDSDLYVANDYGGNRLFRNRGDGTFEDVTESSGVGDTGFGMGVMWFDEDKDGDLDLYVSNMYSTAGKRILSRGWERLSEDRRKRLEKMAGGNTLLRNNGDGTFSDVTADAGVGRAGWAWNAAAYDYDNSGSPHLYISNGFRTSTFTTSDL